jgi:hypothetical protein
MALHQLLRATATGGIMFSLAACGFSGIGSGDSGLFRRSSANPEQSAETRAAAAAEVERIDRGGKASQGTIWDLFSGGNDPNTTVEVNKYLWNATLEVLNFLPVQSVDPFSGVIVTGFGVPPGGGQAYRATVYVQDPALDARSLKVALQTRGGSPVSRDTARAVEDAILTRARQLRVRDSKL